MTGNGFSVRLDALLACAADLQAHSEALIRHSAAMAALHGHALDASHLGDFPEAHMLVRRHHDALADVTDLLQQMRTAFSYADRVAQWIAASYAGTDAAAASSFTALGNRLDALAPGAGLAGAAPQPPRYPPTVTTWSTQ